MKWLFSFLLICSSFFLNAQDTIIIKPGVGFDDVEIGNTRLGKMKRKDYTVTRPGSGKTIYCWSKGGATYSMRTVLIDTVHGMWLTFKSKEVDRSFLIPQIERLVEIRTFAFCNARLPNGLVLNKSTLYDVLGFYGDPNPQLSYSCNSLQYSSLGTTFNFNKEGVLSSMSLYETDSDE